MLCNELRTYIIDILSNTPGHLASSLGTVELAVALHYVFNTADDKLVWDVGHQAYPHKILTGRRESFHTLRQYGGIAGFPKMSESEYDAFGTGHSSTSISAVLGMAVAAQLEGNKSRQHIAVIGDGSLTGGMAFEALNNAGYIKSNILVILNDNDIAIDKNVGGVSRYFSEITSSRAYNRFRNRIWNALGGNSAIKGKRSKGIIRRTLAAVKALLLGSGNMFENIGLRYFGPIDGHNIAHLVKILNSLKNVEGPKLLHIITKKGKGLEKAENNPVTFHSPGKFDVETGEPVDTPSRGDVLPRFQDVFGKKLVDLAKNNPKIVGITPAMATGCGMTYLKETFPKRFFDVGIAEQHAVTFAAGLASQGYLPYVNIYSSFSQRAIDQIIHDVALQKLHIVLCLDRAGLVGEDGATHHGAFDLPLLKSIPNVVISSPYDDVELEKLMTEAQFAEGKVFVIRYPRGRVEKMNTCNLEAGSPDETMKKRVQETTAILSLGAIGHNAENAIAQFATARPAAIPPQHYNFNFLKPLDEARLHAIFKNHNKIITLEDGVMTGGFGSSVVEFAHQNGYPQKVIKLGIPDKFVEHGSIAQLQHECGYDVAGIVETLSL
ncbi:1-deoxy-D-xylulose-5-phosphate synthase [Bacteroidia bacterium]|nr:1-deoxy-D-xylulose-5-phosphate synthase [Bacteroidia bacterium]